MLRPTLALLLLPAALAAQARVIADPMPGIRATEAIAGAQVKQLPSRAPRRPVASQFDSIGSVPLGTVGDSVTLYYFPDGANLSRMRHAQITRRERFLPPTSWRAACDNVAHPGWFYTLDAPPTSSFALVIPGTHAMPMFREPPPLARLGAAAAYKAWADSVWQRYVTVMQPVSDRESASLWWNFYTDAKDALWSRLKFWGLRGPNGHNYAVFSVWLRDDHKDGTLNTTATWIVDGWGRVVARHDGNVDIYGVTDADGDGIDAVITSSGLIAWENGAWQFPSVYNDEPCLLHRVTGPPPGWRP